MTEHPLSTGERGGFGRTAARGAAYSGVAQAINLLIAMASTIIVARILTPSDYGVIAMTAPITGFILVFQNLGLNQALVQAKSLSDEQVNALFYYNMAASGSVALLFLLLAPLVGMFYGDTRPTLIMAASAASVLVTGSALQHSALLNRHMRYKALSLLDVASSAANFLFTLAFALWLRSYWSLFLGSFAGAVVTASLVWIISGWRPSRHVQWRSAQKMVHFGANLTGFNLLNYLSRNLDNVLIAKVWGPAQLGLYDRSYKLMMFPIQSINSPLSRIMLPSLARVQDEPERYRRMYVLAIRAISIASIPGIIAAAICSTELVTILLGERWAAASPIFFWLSLAAVAQPISNASGWLFISSGRTKEMFRWGLVSTPITIGSFIAGLPWGPTGVAAAYFIGQAVRIPILYRWATRGTPVRALDLYATLLSTLIGGGLTWLILLAIRDELSTYQLLIVAFSLSYVSSICVQATMPSGRETLKEISRLLVESLWRRRGNNG